MRKLCLVAVLMALAISAPRFAAAQMNETPVAPSGAPHDPSSTAAPRPLPRNPDQTSLPNQSRTENFKDPSIPRADESPQQQALPEHAIAH